MRIGICDDDKAQLDSIERLTKDYCREYGSSSDFDVKVYTTGFALLDAIEQEGKFDLVILDIMMEEMSGIDIAKELRKSQDNCCIIFQTTSREFAVDAFDLSAIHYLIKPVSAEKLKEAMDKTLEAYGKTSKQYITKKTAYGLESIRMKDIYYCKADDHTVFMYMSDKRMISFSDRMTELFSELSVDSGFIMPHRSYIVNMWWVKQINQNEITMINGENIPLVRRKYKEITDLYFKYTFGRR